MIKKLLYIFFIFVFLSLPIIFLFKFYNNYNFKTISKPNSFYGILNLFGSASMQDLCEDLGDEFSLLFPKISFSKGGNGSSEAVFAVESNVAQIGDISRDLTPSEHPENFSIKTIALDGIAICCNSSNPVKNLSKKQLQEIFSRKIKNWKQLGGKNKKIILIGRDAASGTRTHFEKILNLKTPCKYDVELENNGKVKFKIQNDENAIGYISFSSLDETISSLNINGVSPTLENILNSTYHFSHPLMQITKKDVDDELIKAWFSFLFSKKGAAIIKRNRFIPVNSL